MPEKDTLDNLLTLALQDNEQPAADFTVRVMERVRRTPQLSATRFPLTHRTAAWAAGLAACCTIVLLVLPALRQNSAKNGDSMDFAMPETAMEESAANDENHILTTSGVPQTKSGDDAEEGIDTFSAPACYAAAEESAALEAWLAEKEITAENPADSWVCYYLTAEETAQLRDDMPALSVWTQDVPTDAPLTLFLPEG